MIRHISTLVHRLALLPVLLAVVSLSGLAQAQTTVGEVAAVASVNYTITATAGAGGTITPSGAVSVPEGEDRPFTIAPDPCYSIVDVVVDGVPQGPITSYSFTNVQSDHTISATFVLSSYTLTASAGPNGSISPGGSIPVNCGDEQTFLIVANDCYRIADVLVDGMSVGAVAGYTFSDVQADHTIEATFVLRTYTILATTTPGGTITPSGSVSVDCGGSITFKIEAASCFQLADLRVDGVSIGTPGMVGSGGDSRGKSGGSGSNSGIEYTFNDVREDHTIHAVFVASSYFILAYTGPGGSITSSQDVECGDDATFTITPNPCFQIEDVLVDGISVGPVSTYTFSNVQADHEIYATFAPITYTITATAGAGGSITPAGVVPVNCGGNQSFSITPDSCFSIADVKVDGVSVSNISVYTFTNVQANRTIEATFVRNIYSITASAGAGGTITPNGVVPVLCGDDQTFTIESNPCFRIKRITVNDDGQIAGAAVQLNASQAITTYTFTNVRSNYTITASFERIIHTITATAGPGGSISGSGATTVDCGDELTFGIYPDPCYSIADVVVDGVSQGPVTEYSFTNVVENHTIDATFVLNTFTITSSAGPGGTILPLGVVPVNCGDNSAFTITANVGFVIEDVVVDGGSVGAVGLYSFTDVQTNHTIDATFRDIQPPSITVVYPNGGQNLFVGTGVEYLWTATDNTSLPTVDLYISRDYGATYALEAAAVPNTGSLVTMVSPPGTNTGMAEVYSAYLKVVGSDGVNTVSDSSDAPYSIYDLTVGTVVARFEVMAADEGVEVMWQITTPDLFKTVDLERGDGEEGPWSVVAGERRVESSRVVAADRTAQAGRTYWYRLAAVTHSGSRVAFGPVKGVVSSAREFALSSVSPNPAQGPVRVDFAVAKEGPVDLDVLDIQGRLVSKLVTGVQQAGRYQAVWDGIAGGGRVPAGVYFVRFQGGGRQFTQRFLIAR